MPHDFTRYNGFYELVKSKKAGQNFLFASPDLPRRNFIDRRRYG